MTSRLLLVEPSATMRFVLESYAQSLGFVVVATGEYTQAEDALHQQFRAYGNDFAGVLLGWPIVSNDAADTLIDLLETPDFGDLPVVVMSTDMRAETRAWVAGRENTAVLPWKEYQGLDVLLQRLLETPDKQGDVFETKFDNTDIHILIVDDSVSIRFTLRDLFELQGYQVSLASNHDEAVVAARQTAFDIAIIDFYLHEDTGDNLCKKLLSDAATGQLTCAILTGTYADHIIKRSLRAGAVECMFKNESSELLLARVDALSRFVRQRKHLSVEQHKLDALVDTLAGATVVIGDQDRISYMSEQACKLLGFSQRDNVLGQAAEQFLDISKIRASVPGKYTSQWRDAAQGLVNVGYRQLHVANNGDVVLNFKLLPGRVSNQSESVKNEATSDIISALSLPVEATAFVSTLVAYPQSQSNSSDFASLLIMDVFVSEADAEIKPVHQYPGLVNVINEALLAVYRREGHLAHLGNSRFGLLLRHSTEPQAYLMTRKIMQIANEIDTGHESFKLSSTGCLTKVAKGSEQRSALQLLDKTQQGLGVVNARGQNQALLLDLRRMLPVYASTQK